MREAPPILDVIPDKRAVVGVTFIMFPSYLNLPGFKYGSGNGRVDVEA